MHIVLGYIVIIMLDHNNTKYQHRIQCTLCSKNLQSLFKALEILSLFSVVIEYSSSIFDIASIAARVS